MVVIYFIYIIHTYICIHIHSHINTCVLRWSPQDSLCRYVAQKVYKLFIVRRNTKDPPGDSRYLSIEGVLRMVTEYFCMFHLFIRQWCSLTSITWTSLMNFAARATVAIISPLTLMMCHFLLQPQLSHRGKSPWNVSEI